MVSIVKSSFLPFVCDSLLTISTLDSYKHFPPHIKSLINDLSSGEEVITTLRSYIPCLSSDISLYYIYLNFGYSPEHGSFLTPPVAADLIPYIFKEYHSSISEPEEKCNKSISEVKKVFLDTFYANDLQVLTDPAEFDLLDLNDSGHISLQSI